MGLTDELEAAVPRAVAAVLMLLEEHAVVATEIPEPDDAARAFRAAVSVAWSEMRERLRSTGSSADHSG